MPDSPTPRLRTVGPRITAREHPDWLAADHPPAEGPGTGTSPALPHDVAPRRWPDDVDWRAWFQNLGRQTRVLRELLALSQDRLARLAGVSQGAVSRFERGAVLSTPAVVVFKLAVALARQCRSEDHPELAEPLMRLLDDIEALVPVTSVRHLPAVGSDPQAEQLQRLFRAAPPPARDAVISILRSFCAIAGRKPTDPD